jgi:Fe-S oxidoreductase
LNAIVERIGIMAEARMKTKSVLYNLLEKEGKGGNINECLTCGICNSRCSWYDQEGGPVPRRMVRMSLLGLDGLLARDRMIWDCFLCNRCTVECPMGIQMEKVVRRARALPEADESTPEELKIGIRNRLELGDVNKLSKEEFIETVEWLSGEFAEEVGDPDAEIAYDKPGAKFLYLPNPRELGINLLHLTAMARVFHAFGEPWTMSHRHTDVTNWGYFRGDDTIMRKMILQVVEGAEDLGIETLVLSECGHGYYVLKNLTEKAIGRKPKFQVTSMPELTWEMVERGVIRLDPEVHPVPMAYHDPCNLGRKSGVFDVPRKLLAKICSEIVELEPNRMNSVCCGGGGGLIQDSTSTAKRMIAGKAKADQIRQAGVKHLATVCLSCHRQLGELSKHYDLGVQVHTVMALVAESLVPQT